MKMASLKALLGVLALAFALSVQSALGAVTCEKLDEQTCAFAVSSEGKRCILEKRVSLRSGTEAYMCRESDIEAERMSDVVESDACINDCGLDRKTLGISSDSLMEARFTRQLCSPSCYNACPNVVDLFFNLAAGEGVFLPKLCEAQRGNARRQMGEFRSSGSVPSAPAPFVSAALAAAPLVSPSAEAPAPY